jgi:hypothetical protein
VQGSLDKKGGRCDLLLNKRWHLVPSFLSNEPGTGHIMLYYLNLAVDVLCPMGQLGGEVNQIGRGGHAAGHGHAAVGGGRRRLARQVVVVLGIV